MTNETLIILATKELPLTTENLKTLSSPVQIIGINNMAENELHVRSGFDYEIGKVKSYNNKFCILDNSFIFQAVFEEDLRH